MEDHCCYILFSRSLDRYYIGSTRLSVENRLRQHLSKIYGKNKFTAKADDWDIFLELKCSSEKQARDIEKHIKSMKSKKYIENLKVYPEIIEKLKSKYL